MSGARSTLSTQLIKPVFYVKIFMRNVFIGSVIFEIVLPPLLYKWLQGKQIWGPELDRVVMQITLESE